MATDPEITFAPDVTRLETATVKLPTETLSYLRSEASKRGISTGDMLRLALGTQQFLSEAVDQGGKVQISGKSGRRDVQI